MVTAPVGRISIYRKETLLNMRRYQQKLAGNKARTSTTPAEQAVYELSQWFGSRGEFSRTQERRFQVQRLIHAVLRPGQKVGRRGDRIVDNRKKPESIKGLICRPTTTGKIKLGSTRFSHLFGRRSWEDALRAIEEV